MWRLTLGVVTKKDPHAISHELVCDKAQAAQLTCSLRSFPRSRAGGGLVEDQERHAQPPEVEDVTSLHKSSRSQKNTPSTSNTSTLKVVSTLKYFKVSTLEVGNNERAGGIEWGLKTKLIVDGLATTNGYVLVTLADTKWDTQ